MIKGPPRPASEERAARLDSEQAARIVAATRRSVAERGVAASTFDQITREAGIARGAIFYYFGSKERLLAEMLRRDADARLDLLRDELARADSVQAVLDALLRQLDLFLDRGAHSVLFEMMPMAQRNQAIRSALTDLYRRWRAALTELLAEKEADNVVFLAGDPQGAACVLTALGEGLALQIAADPEWDSGPARRRAEVAARTLLAPSRA